MSRHTRDEKAVSRSQISRADLIGLRVAAWAERRIEIAEAVEAHLGIWSGDQADEFALHWQEWWHGAAQVVDALATNSSALRHTNAQIAAVGRVPRPRPERR